MNTEFNKYIKKLCKGKSLYKLSKDTGVSRTYLFYITKGERGVPSPKMLKKLSKALGVTYEELMKKAGYL